ncbi:MAG: response regulator transcription factor [Opitutaceae bacterium]|nr:response regulator transcription factor [Opitutaceae bacterium]
MCAPDQLNILIADDDRTMRRVVAGVLNGMGDVIVVNECANGREAVTMARARAPDVIIMDIDMPIMNGFDATSEILALAKETKVVVFSSTYAQPYIERAFAVGATGFVSKKKTAHLPDAIRAVLSGRCFLVS